MLPPPPLKVAYACAGELYGGVERFISTLVTHYQSRQTLSALVILFHRGRLYDQLRARGIPMVLVNSSAYHPAMIFRLARLFKEQKISLVHTHGYKATILCSLAAKLARVPVVKSEHGAREPFQGLARLKMALNETLDRWVTRSCVDRLVYITQDLLDQKRLFGKASHAAVIHSGIDPDTIPQNGGPVKGPETIHLGIIGRLVPAKGHAVLLEALTYSRHASRIRLFIAGEGPMKNALQAHAQTLDSHGRIKFMGFQEDVYRFMKQLDALIMPSWQEGLPYTMLESMHMNIPIIASAVGGMKEILKHEKTALLFPAGDAQALARQIDRLIEDPLLRERLVQESRSLAQSRFQVQVMAENYKNLYDDLMSPAAASRQVWLSWDRHRRSLELSEALKMPLRVLQRSSWKLGDPWVPLLKTFWALLTLKEDVVFVQNPSLLLSVMAAFFKRFKRYRLIQDLHSYFSLHLEHPKGLRNKIYSKLSAYVIRRADLTIVTNETLQKLVEEWGGRAFVLPDKLPRLSRETTTLSGRQNVVFVCTYSPDEPVAEVFQAARLLPGDILIHVTGREDRAPLATPPNIIKTGYLSEKDYARLLASADVVMVLTTREHTLLCGAYEAISLGKGLVLSDKKALRDYFTQGVVFVQNEAGSIAQGVLLALAEKDRLRQEIKGWKPLLESAWEKKFHQLTHFTSGPAS